MKKVVKNVLVASLILLCAGVASAEWLTWTGNAGDNLLSTPQNYEMTNDPYTPWTTPLAGNDVLSIRSSANISVDMFEDVVVGRVSVGETNSSANVSLTIKDYSSLSLNGVSNIGMIIGRNGSTGTVTVESDASLVSQGYIHVGNEAGAVGTLNNYGTTYAVKAINNTWGGVGSGRINIYSGEVRTDAWYAPSVDGILDIYEGRMLIGAGWHLTQPALDDGRVMAYGGTGQVNVNYVMIGEKEYMEITASPVPEPATLSIIGLGAIMALRRKKN